MENRHRRKMKRVNKLMRGASALGSKNSSAAHIEKNRLDSQANDMAHLNAEPFGAKIGVGRPSSARRTRPRLLLKREKRKKKISGGVKASISKRRRRRQLDKWAAASYRKCVSAYQATIGALSEIGIGVKSGNVKMKAAVIGVMKHIGGHQRKPHHVFSSATSLAHHSQKASGETHRTAVSPRMTARWLANIAATSQLAEDEQITWRRGGGDIELLAS